MTLGLIIAIILVFVFAGFLKGWAGFGTNLIAPPALIMLGYDFKEAIVIVVSVNIFINIAILIENKKFNFKSLGNIKLLVFFGIIFNFVGIYFLANFDQNILKIIMGILILFTAINKALSFKFKVTNKEKYFIPVGITSGIFNGIAGLGGLPVLILLSNSDMKKDEFRTTLVSFFLVMNIVAIIGYLAGGLYTGYILTNISIVMLFGLASAMFGVYLSRRVNDSIFQKWFVYILLFMGIGLIFNALYTKVGTNMDVIYYFVYSVGGTMVIGMLLYLRTILIKRKKLLK